MDNYVQAIEGAKQAKRNGFFHTFLRIVVRTCCLTFKPLLLRARMTEATVRVDDSSRVHRSHAR